MTIFMTNSKIKPTFVKYAAVMLLQDYTQSGRNRFFTNGAVGSIIESGLSVYGYDPETDDYSKLVDDCEWCFIELSDPTPGFNHSEGFVRAKDLRELSNMDYGLD